MKIYDEITKEELTAPDEVKDICMIAKLRQA